MREIRMKLGLVSLLALAILFNPFRMQELIACSVKTGHSCCPEVKVTEANHQGHQPEKAESESGEKSCKFCNSLQPATHTRQPVSLLVSKKAMEIPLTISSSVIYSSPIQTSFDLKSNSLQHSTSQKDLYLLHSTLLL